MKRIQILILVFLIQSCANIDAKKTDAKTILKEELESFNWNDVDVYPSFTSCDSTISKAEKKYCFESTLIKQVSKVLETQSIVVNTVINDTIVVDFEVTKSGKIYLLRINDDSLITTQIPNLKNMVSASLDSLPKIYPATKRNQQVTARFKLPIIIKMN